MPHHPVFLAQWSDGRGDRGWCSEDTGWDALHAVLGRHEQLVGANFAFDTHSLRAAGIVDLMQSGHKLHDVQTLARVAIPGRFDYKLESLGTDLLGADSTTQQRALKYAAKKHGISWTKEDKDYYGLWKVEPELMVLYGMEDVDLTIALWDKVWTAASQTDRDVYRMEVVGVAPLLRAAERDGVLVDQARLAELRARMESERDAMRTALLAGGLSEEALGVNLDETTYVGTDSARRNADGTLTVGLPSGPASTKALLADLLACGVPLYRKTPKSGEISEKTGKRNPDVLTVNADALKEFEGSHPVVGDLLKWRSCNHTLRNYVSALETADPRVHCQFRQAEARTGRMSAARPNMQNLPVVQKRAEHVQVRDVLVPGLGMAFVCCDYDGIEVRVLAHYIADAELTAQLNDGMDLHQRTAYRVAKANGETCTFEDFAKGGPRDNDRTTAKVTTFTSMYGGGAPLIATRLGVSVPAAARIKAQTLDAIPGYWDLDERVRRAVARRAWPHIVTITGRRLWVPRAKPYVALNCVPEDGTEILTQRGWLRHDEVRVGDKTLGAVNGRAIWTAITSVHHSPAAPVVRLENGSWSAVCTPDHRWLLDRRVVVDGVRTYVGAKPRPLNELVGDDRIRLAVPAEGGDSPVTADEAAIIGWVLTDGHLLYTPPTGAARQGSDAQFCFIKALIGQSKPEGVAELRRLLRDVPHTERRTCNARYTSGEHIVFALSADYTRKLWSRARLAADKHGQDYTEFVCGLSKRARTAFVEAAMAGDGHTSASGQRTFAQNEGPILDAFQLALHLQGVGARRIDPRVISRSSAQHGGVRWARPYVKRDGTRVVAAGAADVWCVETDCGTWTMRQLGNISLTGNTLIQGTAAELMKLGMIAAAPALAAHGYGIRLVVHDELLSEGLAGNAEAALVDCIAAMESAYPLSPRLKATGSTSTISYGAAK